VLVASEPGDDGPGWVDVPDQSVVTAAAGSVVVHPIEVVAAAYAVGDGAVGDGGAGPAGAGLNERMANR
jgi:glutamine amidotransferase